jgi:hypothetical protein
MSNVRTQRAKSRTLLWNLGTCPGYRTATCLWPLPVRVQHLRRSCFCLDCAPRLGRVRIRTTSVDFGARGTHRSTKGFHPAWSRGPDESPRARDRRHAPSAFLAGTRVHPDIIESEFEERLSPCRRDGRIPALAAAGGPSGAERASRCTRRCPSPLPKAGRAWPRPRPSTLWHCIGRRHRRAAPNGSSGTNQWRSGPRPRRGTRRPRGGVDRRVRDGTGLCKGPCGLKA